VRNRSKGEAAARSIEQATTGRTGGGGGGGVVEVWDLDLSSYASVQAFADRASASLDRLDVLVSNAGIVTYEFVLAEDNESTITVNVLGGFLLTVLLLPKLRETSVRFDKETVVTFTGSFVHFMTAFPERRAQNILHDLAVRDRRT
jgi:NAD(P)-dependent dehydrogenase (short-subunit alcohol dehydrogenase family)